MADDEDEEGRRPREAHEADEGAPPRLPRVVRHRGADAERHEAHRLHISSPLPFDTPKSGEEASLTLAEVKFPHSTAAVVQETLH